MNKMLNGLHDSTNVAMTENGATARRTTNSAVLDFFSHGGALRGAGASRAIPLFDSAWAENPELALKAMFYFRDVRGGQGQRQAFRDQLKYLVKLSPETVRKNLPLISEYGRWDDLYSLMDTPLESDVLALFKSQLTEDMKAAKEGANFSLLAKWLKSENASSKQTKLFARKTRKFMGMDSKTYRKLLSSLRAELDVVERKTSSNHWDEIAYSHVPSNAMMKYRKAFRKHDEVRFEDFIGKVNAGEEKVNMGVTYPYEIIHQIGVGYYSKGNISDAEANALWNALPNYVDGEPENAICVVDTSGSMHGTPIEVALSLGIYMAERASGPYKDHFITFSATPKLQKLEGTGIKQKVKNMNDAHWDMNTNIEAVFNLILNVAVKNELAQDEIVTKLYIISDMEFDNCTGRGRVNETLMQSIAAKYQAHGYEMPFLVFWNVDARNKQQPMSMDDRGFQNVSGFSPAIFKALMENQNLDAYGLMLQVLENERYAPLSV
jgi:hypothetical protein